MEREKIHQINDAMLRRLAAARLIHGIDSPQAQEIEERVLRFYERMGAVALPHPSQTIVPDTRTGFDENGDYHMDDSDD